jgi:TonB family protein
MPALRPGKALALVSAIGAVFLAEAPARAQDTRREEGTTTQVKPAPKVTKAPVLIEGAAPEYPAAALAAGLEASVKVRIHIDATGAVSAVDVVEPVGNGFDEAAVAAAMKYRFVAAEIDGAPGAIVVETQIHFVIQEEPIEEPLPVPPPGGPSGSADSTRPPRAPDQPPSHAGDAARPVSVEGEALERGTRRKLSGVIVSIAELGLDAVTDADGRFYFHGIPAGTYRLIAVSDGFDRFGRTLTVAAREHLDVRLWLRPRGGNPYETIVEGEREQLEVTRRTLQRQQLTSVPGTFGDPIRVIQSLPGLARTPFVTGFLIIRGSNPDDSGIFIDGHRIPLIFHFLGGPSIINPEFLESMDLYPGGFPTRFGRAHGGVVAIETRSSKSDGIHGQADVDLLDSGAYVRFPVGKHGSFAVAGRRSYLDLVLSVLLPEPDPGDTLIVVPVYYDYQLRFDYDLEREGKASVFVLGSSDTLDVVQKNAGEEQSLDLNSAIHFFRVIGNYTRPLGRKLRLTLSPAFGRDTVSFDAGQADTGTSFTGIDVVAETFDYRMRVDGRLTPWLVLDTGIDIESRVTYYDVLAPFDDQIPRAGNIEVPPSLVERNVDSLGYGLYADLGIDIGRLRLIPGLRFDGYFLTAQTRFSVDPRLAARYAIDDQWTVKGYAGVFHQPPQPEAVDSRFGNPDVGIERGLHFGLGGEWRPDRLWMVDGEIYYIDRSELVRFTNEVVRNPDGTVTPINFANTGTGNTMGFELLARRELTRNFYGWVSYTLSRSRQQRCPDEEECEEVPTGFDQPHTLNAVASYKTDGGWELGGRFRLSSGRPATRVTGATYDADANSYQATSDQSRDTREKLFHQLDVRVERSWLFDTWSAGIYLDIQNVLNIENTEATQYDYRYRESAPVTGVPFLPTLGIRGQW